MAEGEVRRSRVALRKRSDKLRVLTLREHGPCSDKACTRHYTVTCFNIAKLFVFDCCDASVKWQLYKL